MASPYWDEALAARYRAFQYSFPERPLAGRVVVLAGGAGGLGAAATLLLAREGAKFVGCEFRGPHAAGERFGRCHRADRSRRKPGAPGNDASADAVRFEPELRRAESCPGPRGANSRKTIPR